MKILSTFISRVEYIFHLVDISEYILMTRVLVQCHRLARLLEPTWANLRASGVVMIMSIAG